MPSVIVVGGGLAGLSAAAALAGEGFQVDLYEARGFLGGRATSYPVSPSEPDSEVIDNCQHVLLRCCVNLLDFYGRLGVRNWVRFSSEFYFIEPGGRVSTLRRGSLPAPLHLADSVLSSRFLSIADKLAIDAWNSSAVVAPFKILSSSEALRLLSLNNGQSLQWIYGENHLQL